MGILETLDAASAEFGIRFYLTNSQGFREGAVCGTFRNELGEVGNEITQKPVDDELVQKLKDWFHSKGLLFTYQKTRSNIFAIIGKPSVSIIVGYHVTNSDNVVSILRQGLLPGTIERRTSERLDTVGNCYCVSNLNDTRHWLKEFSKSFSCSVVEIDLRTLQDCLYLDPFSSTGYAIRGAVPAACLRTLALN